MSINTTKLGNVSRTLQKWEPCFSNCLWRWFLHVNPLLLENIYWWGTQGYAHSRRLIFIIQSYLYEYEKSTNIEFYLTFVSEKHDTQWNTFSKSHTIIILCVTLPWHIFLNRHQIWSKWQFLNKLWIWTSSVPGGALPPSRVLLLEWWVCADTHTHTQLQGPWYVGWECSTAFLVAAVR